jgi:hypothetical protein
MRVSLRSAYALTRCAPTGRRKDPKRKPSPNSPRRGREPRPRSGDHWHRARHYLAIGQRHRRQQRHRQAAPPRPGVQPRCIAGRSLTTSRTLSPRELGSRRAYRTASRSAFESTRCCELKSRTVKGGRRPSDKRLGSPGARSMLPDTSEPRNERPTLSKASVSC